MDLKVKQAAPTQGRPKPSHPVIAFRLARRLGVSLSVAAVIATAAGLGPKEARL